MFPHLILAPSYRLLLDRLVSDVRNAAGSSSLTSQWIVTPSSTLAAELRIGLARESESAVIAGVHVVPILPFIDRLSQIDDVPLGPRWNPLFDILLYRLLQQEEGRELAGLRELRGGQTLLRPVFLDLAEAGFGLSQEEVLREVADGEENDRISGGVLRLYFDWLRLLEHAQLTWAPLQYQQLAERISQAPERELSAVLGGAEGRAVRIHVYGFYDFTDVVEQILTSLAQKAETIFYLPASRENGKPHHAFEFVEPVLSSLRYRLGSLLISTTTLEPGEAETLRFFLSTFPEGPIPPQPASLTYQRASGLRAEVISAAIRVRRWLDDKSFELAPRDIQVLAPQSGTYAELIREIFQAFSIPLRVAEAPDELTPNERALRTIARIWEEAAPTEALFSLFRDFPDISCLKGIELDLFEIKLRRAGFDGQNWPGVLKHGDLIGLSPAERALIQEIVELWTNRPGGSSEAGFCVNEILSRLEQISQRWLPDPAPIAQLIETLGLLPSELRLPLPIVLDLLENQAAQGVISDPPEKTGILFAPLMRARGLAPRAVVLLGLASGRLPYPVQEDPMLGDALRLKLGQAMRDLGHRFSPKTALSEEMALLFILLNGSSERVHWVIPDTDENGRGLAPTPWVQRYLQHWERNAANRPDHAALPRGPAEQARLLLLLEPQSGSFLPPVWSPHLQRDSGVGIGSADHGYILRAIAEKEHESRWNGLVPDAALVSLSSPATVRVTELEKLSKCPFQCYSRLITGWEVLTPLDFSPDLKSTEWGSLLHGLFETTVRGYREAGLSLRHMAEDLLQNDARSLCERIEALAADASLQLELLPSLFRKAAKGKLLQLATEYWEAVRSGAIPEGVNASTESRCNADFPGLPGVRLSGQIDRMDDRGDHFMIIDYKSGREPDGLCHEMRMGFRLQPLLYPWLQQASAQTTGAPIRFSYVFFAKSPIQEKTVSVDQMTPVEEWLSLFADILSRGIFIPCSNEALELLGVERAEPCQFCEYASLCRRFERQAPARMAHFLEQLLPERLAKFDQG
ncbi:MAG: PD-(D/E)XK nuclease family protein [Acidobacteria bacterium]|nr:MAG: PD-(D/E)XK nuclease family protein [Acidobacteriota bacterium]